MTANAEQIMLGHYYPDRLVATFWNSVGDFLRIEERPLDTELSNFDSERDRWLDELGYVQKPIAMKKFYDPVYCIGIEDFSGQLDLLNYPERISEDERMDILKYAWDWFENREYVFWWGPVDLWVNEAGQVTAN
ncbi:MAG: hypothetical protein AAFV33_28410 [Chloroflexota bacterium]